MWIIFNVLPLHVVKKIVHPSPPRKSVLFCTVFLFIEKPLPFSSIFVVLPRNRYSLSKQARIKHKATISLYRLLGVDFFVRFFFVERGGLGCFQTATRYACRTTFRCAHFALASKLARSLLSESTPNNKERIARCAFLCVERGGFGCFFKKQPHALRVEPPFGADAWAICTSAALRY